MIGKQKTIYLTIRPHYLLLSACDKTLRPQEEDGKVPILLFYYGKVIDGLYYTESHEYVKVDGNIGTIGITDYAQNALGNVVYVDMPEVDDDVEAGEEFGAVESVKAASDLNSPVSGKVVEVNEALEDKPELVNQDAFANWIIKVELSDKTELDALMDAKAYEEFCAKEEH